MAPVGAGVVDLTEKLDVVDEAATVVVGVGDMEGGSELDEALLDDPDDRVVDTVLTDGVLPDVEGFVGPLVDTLVELLDTGPALVDTLPSVVESVACLVDGLVADTELGSDAVVTAGVEDDGILVELRIDTVAVLVVVAGQVWAEKDINCGWIQWFLAPMGTNCNLNLNTPTRGCI